ncbi:MAG: amidase domain-containing protein [Clostridium sp.]|jgi:hypothetical protein|nr:amidase domain-containing protein [Clostridium sp.]
MKYNRRKAVEYAHKWAFGRNPRYLDFSGLGGDCTNFISQCLLAGGLPMNYRKNFGWYYHSSYDRAPAWTSVQYFYQFLTDNQEAGPKADEVPLKDVQIGDVVQLSFDGAVFHHSLLVVEVKAPDTTGEGGSAVPGMDQILIATHTDDSDYRRLSTYTAMRSYRCLKIRG